MIRCDQCETGEVAHHTELMLTMHAPTLEATTLFECQGDLCDRCTNLWLKGLKQLKDGRPVAIKPDGR